MTTFDVVLVAFPFADLRSGKQRPCLVLRSFSVAGAGNHAVVAMMTSKLNGLAFPADTPLQHWRDAGLPKPTLVRLAKLVTLEQSLVRRTLGHLHAGDIPRVIRSFTALFEALTDAPRRA